MTPKSSFLGGGTVGCNWQPIGSPFVLGIEGELGYLRLTGSAIDPTQPVLGLAPSVTSNTRIGDWYGMITGRLGYAWDRAMVYVKGGVAFVDVETTVTDPIFNPGFVASTSRFDGGLDGRRRHRVGVRLELERQGRIHVHRPRQQCGLRLQRQSRQWTRSYRKLLLEP